MSLTDPIHTSECSRQEIHQQNRERHNNRI